MLTKLLIIEKDQGLQKYLKDFCIKNSLDVDLVDDGITALRKIKKSTPDMVIFDFDLPDMTGQSAFLEIKKHHPDLPVISLTTKDAATETISKLNLNTDDFIIKPFTADELLTRINVKLKLQNSDIKHTLTVDGLSLDNKTFEVKRNGILIQLTPQEFKLLEYLMNNQGRILTREMILNRVWLYSPDIETRVVDVYMGYLRKKIDQNFEKKLLHSVRGFGYMIKN